MFSAFLQSPTTVGALTRYSQHSINLILSTIDRNTDMNIVEYGPGNGSITTSILKKMSPKSRLSAFELNKDLFEKELNLLSDTRLSIHYKSCEQAYEYLDNNSVDLIVSTIPLSLLDKPTLSSIISTSYNLLRPEGIFTTAQYSSYAKQTLHNQFGNATSKRTARNFPPTTIISSKK